MLFLVHGSSISARPSFDLTVPGGGEYSLMNVFARYGFDVWTMDHEWLPNRDRQFVVLAGAAHSLGMDKNRHRLWHVMRAFLEMPPRLDRGEGGR